MPPLAGHRWFPGASWSAPALAVGVVATMLLASYDRMWGDTYMNLYAGRYVVEHGIPTTDPFTIAGSGRSWVDSQWLAHVAFYGAWSLGGYALVTRTSILALVVAYALLGWLLAARGAGLLQQALLPPTALLLSFPLLFPRAQNLAVPIFVVMLALVLRDDARGRLPPPRQAWPTVLVLLLLLVLWMNLHGSALMAAGLLLAYAWWRLLRSRRQAGRRRGAVAPWLALAAGALLAPLATPYGTKLLLSHASVLGSAALQAHTTEWAPAWVPIGLVQVAVPVMLATVLLVAARRRRAPVQPPLAAAALVLAGASVLQARYVVWLCIVLAVLAADVLPAGPSPRRSWSAAMAIGALATFGMVALLLASVGPERQLRDSPIDTVERAYRAAAAQPDATFLADLDSSAVLLWLHPAVHGRVAYDPRLEVFASDDLATWLRFQYVEGSDWAAPMRDHDVVMASATWRPRLAAKLRRLDGWRAIRTSDGVVAIRDADAAESRPHSETTRASSNSSPAHS